MLCHGKESSSQNNGNRQSAIEIVNAENTDKPSGVRRLLGVAGVVSASFFAPHIICVGTGVLASAGIGITAFCWHHNKEADSSQGISELKRLPAVPEKFIKFSEDRAESAWNALLTVEPRFQTILEAKQKEAGSEPVKVVFLEDLDTNSAVCVICKNGEFCPCSKPQAWELGKKNEISVQEYPGQIEVLKALYQEQ